MTFSLCPPGKFLLVSSRPVAPSPTKSEWGQGRGTIWSSEALPPAQSGWGEAQTGLMHEEQCESRHGVSGRPCERQRLMRPEDREAESGSVRRAGLVEGEPGGHKSSWGMRPGPMCSVGCAFWRDRRTESGELGRSGYEHRGFRTGLQNLSADCK